MAISKELQDRVDAINGIAVSPEFEVTAADLILDDIKKADDTEITDYRGKVNGFLSLVKKVYKSNAQNKEVEIVREFELKIKDDKPHCNYIKKETKTIIKEG